MPTLESFNHLAGISDIVIADRLSDANQKRIRGTTNLVVSWELSNAGMLTCEVPLTDLRELYGIDHSTLMSKWIHYRHPTAGPWGGVITSVEGDDGIISIGAESWAAAMRGATTTGVAAAGGRMIATLMHQIDLNSAHTGVFRGIGDTSISATQATDVLPEVEFFAEGQDLYDQFLPAVMSTWYQAFGDRAGLQAAGWNVDPVTRKFSFDSTWGQDLSRVVALRDRLHNTSSGWSDDTIDIVNRVVLRAQFIGGIEKTVVGNVEESQQRHGHRSLLITDDTMYWTEAAQREAARRRAATLSRNEQPVTVYCADVNQAFAYFREGDIIWAALTNSGMQGRMVARLRSLDVTTGVMTVSGEAELSA